MNGTVYDEMDAMRMYAEASEEFKQENLSFIGSKCIYAPSKTAINKTINRYFELVRKFYENYPEFVAGFDLVGKEDISPSLLSFAEHILKLPSEIQFFFHAGETNWFGSADENLVNSEY